MYSEYHNELQKELSYEAISRALMERYESIYAVDIETSAYQCFHESDSYSSLQIEMSGNDFFDAAGNNIFETIYPEDQAYVLQKLTKDALLKGLEEAGNYVFVYRLVINGEPIYHKLSAIREIVNGRPHFLMGIRNIDKAFRRELAHTQEVSVLQRKEKNHLEAILSTSTGYFEANLTQDVMLERSAYAFEKEFRSAPPPLDGEIPLRYSDFKSWMAENLVFRNAEKYHEISDREYLIQCFNEGERRASVSFSSQTPTGQLRPCKMVFYLYEDGFPGDVLAFCVIYDLTEHQRREKELRELEKELQMSRIRNFTSQMQPHFLYNALGSIQEIVLDDPAYASELIGDFTVHLRSCIRAMANDAPIPLEQELSNIRAYINIEKMRFGDKLKVVYDIKERGFSILPLSIQPIVENAVRHGIYERGERGGTVIIRTEQEKDAWKVVVEDDGVGFDVQEYHHRLAAGKGDSTGLKNIMFRLDKVMHATVDIASVIGKGTVVTISIPKGGTKDESDYS